MVRILRQVAQVMQLLLSSTLLVVAIVFAELKQQDSMCRNISITISGDKTQKFITREVVLQYIAPCTETTAKHTMLRTIKTHIIGNRLKKNNFVHDGVVYKNWQGDLKIVVLPRRPIARIIHAHQPSYYIDAAGIFLPLSAQYTARVLLVEVAQLRSTTSNLTEQPYGTALLNLLNYIDRDPFWRAQIAYMCVDTKGKVVMHTQVGKQRIEFGSPTAITEKFTKLMLFYKHIIPYKGYNAYKRINLEFNQQIVCE